MFNPGTPPDRASEISSVKDVIDSTYAALTGWLDARGTQDWDADAQGLYDRAIAQVDEGYSLLRDLLREDGN